MSRPAPALPERHPYEIYLTFLVLVSSVPSAFGLAPLPVSITSQVDRWAGYVWVWLLFSGALLVVLGIAWPRPRHKALFSVTALLLERTGLIWLSMSCVFYAGAILVHTGWSAILPASVVLGYGLSNLVLARRIWKVIKGAGAS